MNSRSRLLLKFAAVFAMGCFMILSPVWAQAESGGDGTCGACAWQNVPCGGSQALMDQGCKDQCPGKPHASGCTANDPLCAPIFADGWTCSA